MFKISVYVYTHTLTHVCRYTAHILQISYVSTNIQIYIHIYIRACKCKFGKFNDLAAQSQFIVDYNGTK